MGEFSGYKCDGPNCENQVDKKSPEARRWLLVGVKTEDFNQQYTFCSYNCLHDHTEEILINQDPAFAL